MCSKCSNDKKCSVIGDCTSDYCNPDNKCSTPSCSDGWKNQDESDVDCGGATCPNKCADGKGCNSNGDCTSKICSIPDTPPGTCVIATCDDNVMNGDETDVDCGGTCTNACAESKKCLVDNDCLSKNCVNNVCEVGCFDGIVNQNETDVDCGGVCGATCINGKSCERNDDCVGAYCNPETVCSSPTCSDGWKNQDETDVDCGGSCATKCLIDRSCKVNGDCQSGLCDNSVCVDPPPVASPQSVPTSSPQSNEPVTTPTNTATPVSNTPGRKIVSSAVGLRCNLLAAALLFIFI